jgi:CRP/FNR family transcriptional regulator, nitrogen oxide reductase regulator
VRDSKEICRSVMNSELFVGIPSCEIAEMVCRARTLEFVPGDVIHSADEPIKQVLLLVDGRIKKSQFSENGQEVVLRLGIPGEMICESTLLSERKHSSTVLALQHCKVLAWETAKFSAMVKRSPRLLKNVELILRSRLEEVTQRYWEVSTKTTSPRLAVVLAYLVDRIGKKVGEHIELRLSQETLGQMTGMTLNSVWRLLSIWKAQGLVKLRRGTIEIHNLPHLLSCAELARSSASNAVLRDEAVVSGTMIDGADAAVSQATGD